jgi:PAS domain-containing protein
MIQLILKYRVQLLVSLIILEIFLTIGVYFEEINSARIYFILECLVSFLILIIAVTFLDKLNLYLFLTSKHEYLQNIAPCSYIFYDTKKHKVLIPDYTCKMLGMQIKNNYHLDDIASLFSAKDWVEIEACIKQPSMVSVHEKIGMIRYETKHSETKHFKYSLQYIEDKKYMIHGVILWFTDFSDSIEHEESIISLIKKYRVMSFELDYLFNHLPIPVWRREGDGSVVFANNAFKKLIKKFSSEGEINEFETGLKRLAEIGTKEKRTAKITRSFMSKNKSVSYEFNEVPVASTSGTVGFGIDITRNEEVEKSFNIVANTLDRILELSSNAIMILDKDGNIFQFNQVLVNMFGLDPKWLADKPSYSNFWDKLRELNKLPEFKNYKEFKDAQISLIRHLTEPKSDFMHMPNGQTVRFSVIPSAKNTIVMFDNLTDVLNVERSYNELMSVYKAMVHQLKHSIAIFGQDGKLKLYNPSFSKFAKVDEEFLSTLPHVSDILLHENSNLKSQSAIDLKSKVINCIESRKNSVMEIHDELGNICQAEVSSLPDNGVLLTVNL